MKSVWDRLKQARRKDDPTPRRQNGRAGAHIGSLDWLLEAKTDTEYRYRLQIFSAETLEPLVRRCVAQRLGLPSDRPLSRLECPRESDLKDIRSLVLERLITALYQAWASWHDGTTRCVSPIRDLEAYVRKTVDTQHADLIRTPAWRRFDYQLRRVIEQHSLLATWKGEGDRLLVGRAHWQHSSSPPVALPAPEAFLGSHGPTLRTAQSRAAVEAAVVLAVVDCAGAPLLFHDVRALLAVFYQVAEPRRSFLAEADLSLDAAENSGAGAANPVETAVLEVDRIAGIWSEIQRMPLPWRQVMILGIDDLLAYLLAQRIASPSAVATALDLTERELLELFAQVPLSDELLATRMGVVVATVRNYRWEARKALRKYLVEQE